MEARNETVWTAALSKHARETEIYSEKISDFQRPLDKSASNDNMISGNAEEEELSIKHTQGGSYGHIGGSSFSARCSLASSGAAAVVDTKDQSEAHSVSVTDTDVRKILCVTAEIFSNFFA